MKKNKLSILTFLAISFSGLFSCQTDLLDLAPETSYPSEDVFDTPVRIDQQVNGLYDFVKDGNFLGSRYLVYNDIRAEEFINRLTNGVTGLQTYNHTLVESTNEVNNLWIAAYQAINQINVFLKGLDDNAATLVPPIFPATFATTADEYRAEARFLRAVSYYSLLQLYARPYVNSNGSDLGVPLRLQAEANFENNNLKRSTVAEVYTQILADLDFAEQKLPATRTGAIAPNRAHKNTAIAFKTRVYLTMHQWDNVITEADKIVSASAPFKAPTGVAHQLSSTFAAVFATPYQSAESIFSLPFSTLDPPGTQNQLGYYYLPASAGTPSTNTGNGEYYLNRKGILGDTATLSLADDRRKQTTKVYIRNSSQVITDSTYYLTKFSSASPYTDSSPIMRYAEVLLNLAEARVRSTESVDARALELLNAVRTRSKGVAYDAADFADYVEFINAILKERRAEFLGEGLRSIDCMRLNAPIPGKSTISAVNPSDPNYVWPMPSSELFVNQDLEKN
ncbi:RagB/SusD family nutrient uptake outer membrane protein [Ohtaekwangia koreensis]|uniref:SusD family protein n=1 Tax=Ohtaekwangia koreensis TaxID=688867 RepID=A0A1T5LLM7_9BACT|nr:RagB/SusD family nutrient uptake outer membrane protein [Ohtaekwangia koreensis]SKC76774.1 SusD family protein [Ohtaekwangia koreensis]